MPLIYVRFIPSFQLFCCYRVDYALGLIYLRETLCLSFLNRMTSQFIVHIQVITMQKVTTTLVFLIVDIHEAVLLTGDRIFNVLK